MDAETLKQLLIGGLATLAFSAVSFLARSYFKRIHEDIKELKQSFKEESRAGAKVEGAVEMLARSVQSNADASTRMQTEVNAIWKFLDGAHQRASDVKHLRG